jgi:hypothetical protein
MFVKLWAESKFKATLRLFERRIKDKIKETETFVITDCLSYVFPFGCCLLSNFSCAVVAYVLFILINKLSDLKLYGYGCRLVDPMS